MDLAAANNAIWFPLAYALHIVAERHEALSENLRLPIDRPKIRGREVPVVQYFDHRGLLCRLKARSELFELPAATSRAVCPP